MTLGEKILILRKQHGMSQEQLAERITISRQAISRWELNESVPDVDNIIQLSKIFGVSTDYLLTGVEISMEEEAVAPAAADVIIHEMLPRKTGRGKRPDSLRWLRKASLMCGIASPAIYLVLGFAFGWWHPGWLIFPASWLIYAGCMAAKYSP